MEQHYRFGKKWKQGQVGHFIENVWKYATELFLFLLFSPEKISEVDIQSCYGFLFLFARLLVSEDIVAYAKWPKIWIEKQSFLN